MIFFNNSILICSSQKKDVAWLQNLKKDMGYIYGLFLKLCSLWLQYAFIEWKRAACILFKTSPFVFHRIKKVIHVLNEMTVSK